MFRLAILIMAVLAAARATPARDLFVSNVAGDDRFDGQAPQFAANGSGPVHSIGRALALALPGDRVVVANTSVPYHESLSLSAAKHCGTVVAPFVIESDGAILDGAIPVNPLGWEPFQANVFRYSPKLKSHQQLFFNGQPLARRPLVNGALDWRALQPLEYSVFEGCLYFCVEQGRLPADYALFCSGFRTGVTLDHVHGVAISGLVLRHFQIDGLQASDGVRDCLVVDVTSSANGRAGFVAAGSSELTFRGCHASDNRHAQLLTQGLSTVGVEECRLLDAVAPAIVHRGRTLFVDGQRQTREPAPSNAAAQ